MSHIEKGVEDVQAFGRGSKRVLRSIVFLGTGVDRGPRVCLLFGSGQEIEMRENSAYPGRRASAAAQRVAVLAVVLACVGCGASRTRSPFVSQSDQRINIEVVNYNFNQITLHAVWPGRRVRLGIVNASGTTNFMLPWDGSDLLSLEIHVLAGDDCVTPQIWADPGDIIVLEIQSRIRYGLDCFPIR
jgi:hypothetical protein